MNMNATEPRRAEQALDAILAELTEGRIKLYRNVLFGAMALAVAVGFRLSQERFRVTTMDFLVVLITLVVLALFAAQDGPGNAGPAIVMLVILFYGVELVLNNIGRRWDVMRYVVMLTLALLAYRGISAALA